MYSWDVPMHLILFRLNMIFQERSGGSLGNRTQRKKWLKEELGQRISSVMSIRNASCLDMGQSHKKFPQDDLICSEKWIQRDFRQSEKGWGQHGLCVVVLLTQPCMHTCALHTRVDWAAHASHYVSTVINSKQNQHGIWFPGPGRLLGESGQTKQSNRNLETVKVL